MNEKVVRSYKWKNERNCELIFKHCVNVTPAAVRKTCSDLLKEVNLVRYEDTSCDVGPKSLECVSTDRRLRIHFHFSVCSRLFLSHSHPTFSEFFCSRSTRIVSLTRRSMDSATNLEVAAIRCARKVVIATVPMKMTAIS